MDRDLALGLIGLAVALVYLSLASLIPESVSSDPVGATGMPHLLGYTLLVVSVLFSGQRVLALRTGISDPEPEKRGVFEEPVRAFLAASGAVAICAVFVFIFEPAGYALSIGLLIFAMAAYQGVPLGRRLVATSVGGALVLWLLFAKLLSVRVPTGIWPDLF
jgi:putative tricarboxylic transport membrane protein